MEEDYTKTDANNWYKLHQLVNIIKHKSRYIVEEPYKTFIDSIMNIINVEFKSILNANSTLYRARINDIDLEKRDNEKKPYPPDKMGPPPLYLTKSGRINPEGIPFLYCAEDTDTAGSELRPQKGMFLTIAEINIKQDIPIVDLTLECNNKNWKLFFYDFSELFSMQWPENLKLNYLVTQYFSEHLKALGYSPDFLAGDAGLQR